MTTCLVKMTEQERQATQPALEKNRADWKAAHQQGVDLDPTCKAALSSLDQREACKF